MKLPRNVLDALAKRPWGTKIGQITYNVVGIFDGATFFWGERGWSDDPRDALHYNYAGALAVAAGKVWTDGRLERRAQIVPEVPV